MVSGLLTQPFSGSGIQFNRRPRTICTKPERGKRRAPKKIGQYNCYKATYDKEVQERVFSFGSQNQNQNQNNLITKKVEVSAWFTPDIPVSTGPSWYQGLPGLILEVNDNNTTILCTKIVINPTDKSKIKKPKRGKVISNVDFIALQEQKRLEAREMWQSRMRRSGGGRPSNN